MVALTDDVYKLFDDVTEQVSKNVYNLMQQLWQNWSHVGVEYDVKVDNIYKLVQIEKDLHRDVLLETMQMIKTMQNQVDQLKEETKQLSEYLSIHIPIMEHQEDMMLFEYKKELENQIVGYREQVEQRRTEIDRLLAWQHDLTDKLGVTFQELQDVPLPAEEELNKLKNHLLVLQSERDKRTEIFLHTQIEIKDIMEKLQIKPQSKFEQVVVSALSVDFKVTDLNMDRLAKLRQDLQEKYDLTNNRVLELRERLSRLWDCLDEDQIYRDNFLQAHPGCHPLTESAIKEEIKRCEQIKRQKIQVFVANMRTKIKLMWDNIMYSQREREEFIHYYQDIFTEDTLTLHEMYLDKITKYYNENKHIYELVVTRNNLWMKQAELDARASEPGRFHNRGGNLLREEKERKAIEIKLPKIEAQLQEMAIEYEARTGNSFKVDGIPLLQLIEDEKESRKTERQNKLSARKQALTPSNPLFRSLATSPGKRNRTAAGQAHTAERNRVPSRRQLITGSATKAVSAITNNLSALKRSAISTVKRRVSGRIAAKAIVTKAENHGATVKRKLDYGAEVKKTPKANGSILKHKRTSVGKRRSSGRRSTHNTHSTASREEAKKDPAMDTTTYTDFKNCINEKPVSRSSMANKVPENFIPLITFDAIEEKNTHDTPKKTPRKQGPMTPKINKENIQTHNAYATPKTNLLYTPSRLTRSSVKLNNDGFATPRAPLSAAKTNMQRQNSNNNLAFKTTPNHMIRSNTQTGLMRTGKPFV